MLHLGPFTACVTIDGHELEQYQVVISNNGTKATCWIASEAGKVCPIHKSTERWQVTEPEICLQQFAVKWKDSSLQRLERTSGSVKIDGIPCGSKSIHPGKAGRRDSAQRTYLSTGPTSTRPYMFSLFIWSVNYHLSRPPSQAVGAIGRR